MKKVQFGSGSNQLPGWDNRQERDANITQRLPYADNEVDFILIEHCLEHVTQHEAYRFLKEAGRILRPGGVLRVIVPDIKNIWENGDDSYLDWQRAGVSQDGWWEHAGAPMAPQLAKLKANPQYVPTREDAVATIIYCHGHKSIWTPEMLTTLLTVTGFAAQIQPYGVSSFAELNDVDSHWKMAGPDGRHKVAVESVCAEGVKT